MTDNDQKERSPLLPDRHPEPDFFVCDIFDAAPKSDIAPMEHPLFTLSTKPDHTPRKYRNGDVYLNLEASPIGLATVHDRDVLIYCISQCMARLNKNQKISKTMRFHAHDLMKVTNRDTTGPGYRNFRNTLKRLQGTQIETNITTGGKEQWKVFSFIDSAEIVRETRDGRMQEVEITLSDWVFDAINEKGGEILTISRDYFRLRKPLERRLYELARKWCGQNTYWHFTLKTMHERTGSTSSLKEFRRMLTKIIEDNKKHGHIPDYTFELNGDLVKVRPRDSFTEIYTETTNTSQIDMIFLKSETFETARTFAAGYDLHFLEREWRNMMTQKKAMPEKPDGAFIGYVKYYVEKHGSAR
ncbi:replication initiator protein A [Pelagibius sp. Alg239-R121]|uniref:replication initiator protein A n=1 Tax=Pelagibius sp. Alg239-R121 TaxID=2993448 RepID=UPI0024A624B9|nr:replication initiator protein A [Pelagibius sp. Alg239-R121]